MAKLRKRMIVLKTSRLLKENELLLFYHALSNRSGFNKIKIFSELVANNFLHRGFSLSEAKRGSELSSLTECHSFVQGLDARSKAAFRTKDRSSDRPFGEVCRVGKPNLLQVKNKVGIKAFRSIFFKFFEESQSQFQSYPLLANKGCQFFKDKKIQENLALASIKPCKNFSQLCRNPAENKQDFCTAEKKADLSAKITASPDKVYALLQGGGTIIIGVKKLAFLQKAVHQNTVNFFSKKLTNDKNFLLLGGIYRAQLVTIKTLKRLCNLGDQEMYYKKLIIFFREKILQVLLKSHPLQCIHKRAFCMVSCVQFKLILLIYILKNYNPPKKRKLSYQLYVSSEHSKIL